jgi:hypothetical protein
MPDPAPVINATLLASFILLSSLKAQSLIVVFFDFVVPSHLTLQIFH